MKAFFTLLILSGFHLASFAQYYYSFEESPSFYKRSIFLKSNGFQKETLVITQRKGDDLVDSFKMFTNYYDSTGSIISEYKNTKWSNPVIIDSFAYDADGTRVRLKLKFSDVRPDNDSVATEQDVEASAPTKYLYTHSKYDSLNRVKKVFQKHSGSSDNLVKLIFYDDQNRITKIDFAPESENVYFKEYVYKKNKLKIW